MIESIFIFAYFLGKSHTGTHLAISEDGLHFTPVLNGEAVIKPEQGLMRDPFLFYAEHEEQFHLIWTTEWESQTIGHATSKNLVEWSEQTQLPVMQGFDGVRNCWAPEMIWDESNEQYVIFWASTIEGMFPETAGQSENNYNHRMWYTTTKDFKQLEPAQIFYNPGFSVIDSTLIENEGTYYLITKDERLIPENKFLFVSTSDKPTGPWSEPGPAISDHWVEGPATTYSNGQWTVFFDRYRNHQYGAVTSSDLKTWKTADESISIPEGSRHGSFVRVPKTLVKHLLD